MAKRRRRPAALVLGVLGIALAVAGGHDTTLSASLLTDKKADSETCSGNDCATMPSPACPPLLSLSASDLAFFVINLDRSTDRLKAMTKAFEDANLPPFTRIAGVIVTESDSNDSTIPIRRRSKQIKLGDWGCALGHYAAWKAVANGNKPWGIILEDDVEPGPGLTLDDMASDLARVPVDADLVLLNPATLSMTMAEDVCEGLNVQRITWGRGMFAYLVSRDSARRLMDKARTHAAVPVDGFTWRNSVYTTRRDLFVHPCRHPCKKSVRQDINQATSGPKP